MVFGDALQNLAELCRARNAGRLLVKSLFSGSGIMGSFMHQFINVSIRLLTNGVSL